MLKELVQELNQILINVENLTKENRELKTEKETINSQFLLMFGLILVLILLTYLLKILSLYIYIY